MDRRGARLLQSGWREHVRDHNPRTRRPARRVSPHRRRALPRQGGIASFLTALNWLAEPCLTQVLNLWPEPKTTVFLSSAFTGPVPFISSIYSYLH